MRGHAWHDAMANTEVLNLLRPVLIDGGHLALRLPDLFGARNVVRVFKNTQAAGGLQVGVQGVGGVDPLVGIPLAEWIIPGHQSKFILVTDGGPVIIAPDDG